MVSASYPFDHSGFRSAISTTLDPFFDIVQQWQRGTEMGRWLRCQDLPPFETFPHDMFRTVQCMIAKIDQLRGDNLASETFGLIEGVPIGAVSPRYKFICSKQKIDDPSLVHLGTLVASWDGEECYVTPWPDRDDPVLLVFYQGAPATTVVETVVAGQEAQM